MTTFFFIENKIHPLITKLSRCTPDLFHRCYTHTLENGETLQVTTTYFHFWIKSYQNKRAPLYLFRLVTAIIISVFLLIDCFRDREHAHLYSKANYIPWPFVPFNIPYMMIFVTYWIHIKLFHTYEKVDFTYPMDHQFDLERHFEPFPLEKPDISFIYFLSIMLSILPPFFFTHMIMYFQTNNYKTSILEWQQTTLILVTTIFTGVDHLYSNYYMEFSHMYLGYAWVVSGIFIGCFIARLLGLVAYPIFDYIDNTKEAIGATIYFCALYGVFFMIFYGMALFKQGKNHPFQTAPWFRRNPVTAQIKDIEQLGIFEIK